MPYSVNASQNQKALKFKDSVFNRIVQSEIATDIISRFYFCTQNQQGNKDGKENSSYQLGSIRVVQSCG